MENICIKINLPLTEEAYISGNGEGVWVEVDQNTKNDYNNNVIGKGYTGILRNDSIYYPTLKNGFKINFELRGNERPVADYEFLKDKIHLTEVGKAAIVRKLMES